MGITMSDSAQKSRHIKHLPEMNHLFPDLFQDSVHAADKGKKMRHSFFTAFADAGMFKTPLHFCSF